jgi:hypothetical protein
MEGLNTGNEAQIFLRAGFKLVSGVGDFWLRPDDNNV